jgi:hypothetical protein
MTRKRLYLAEFAALVRDVAEELSHVVVERDLVHLHQLLSSASAEDQLDWWMDGNVSGDDGG